jgi:outer membrane protein OmpA-like peptidoglycan-associated protein
MYFRASFSAAALLVLGACMGMAGQQTASAPFDPAACTQRDFNVYFEEGSRELTAEARRVIELEAGAIRGCSIDSVRIIGLSDEDEGNAETTRQLSVERAETLADFLAQRASWPRTRFQLLATGERGAETAEGLDVPVRNRARIIVAASAP